MGQGPGVIRQRGALLGLVLGSRELVACPAGREGVRTAFPGGCSRFLLSSCPSCQRPLCYRCHNGHYHGEWAPGP